MVDLPRSQIFVCLLEKEIYVKCTQKLQNFVNILINHFTFDFDCLEVF
uniref:Uncharacterized protein n=1 Tax=Arundo donax TaxID=35708 RepID=A0A0A9AQV8_ARUDO